MPPSAQAPVRPTHAGYHGHHGWGGWGWGWRAAGTAPGDILRGKASVIRAQGQYNLDTSAAMINAKEAKKRGIYNHRYGVETYFELRQYNRDMRAKERLPAPTPAQIERLAKLGLPERTTPSEVQPTSGDINWPVALEMSNFADERARMETLFSQRDQLEDGVETGTHALVKQCADQMHAELKTYVDDLDPETYLDARKFIEKLIYESRFSAPNENVAKVRNASHVR